MNYVRTYYKDKVILHRSLLLGICSTTYIINTYICMRNVMYTCMSYICACYFFM